jgi:hypothetical protein
MKIYDKTSEILQRISDRKNIEILGCNLLFIFFPVKVGRKELS